MIEKLYLKNFTAFTEIDLAFSPGVNLFIGANGTGKTHILKVLYAVCTAPKHDLYIWYRASQVFSPSQKDPERLINYINYPDEVGATVKIVKNGELVSSYIEKNSMAGDPTWQNNDEETYVYIPVKEMLANAPGFRSLYNLREVHFEAIYADIIDLVLLPPLKGKYLPNFQALLSTLKKAIAGEVVVKGEHFYLSNQQGELEFMLVAEGIRKLALLWLLIRNGSLQKGSTLFWDEPEANLNPALIKTVVSILLQLQTMGVQIFIATHNYVLLREFDLQSKQDTPIRFFSLYQDEETANIKYHSGETYHSIMPNKISEAYTDIYDKAVSRTLGALL